MEVKTNLDEFLSRWPRYTFVPRCQKWTPTGGVVVAAEWRTLETARIVVLF